MCYIKNSAWKTFLHIGGMEKMMGKCNVHLVRNKLKCLCP